MSYRNGGKQMAKKKYSAVKTIRQTEPADASEQDAIAAQGSATLASPIAEIPEAELWRARLRGYVPGGRWTDKWGPRPETGRCKASPRELKAWKVRQGLMR